MNDMMATARRVWTHHRHSHSVFRSFSWRSRLVVFSAIFFTFGSVGFISDIWTVRQLHPWAFVWANVTFAGVEAAIRRHLQRPLAKLYAEILEAVRAHGPQVDDQTLLLVRAR